MEKGDLTGILWHQGESDSGNYDDAASYGERFQEMICSLRAELSAERVPVLAGGLGDFLRNREDSEFFELVNQQLRDLESTLPGYAYVGADKLHDRGDFLHFSSASLRALGLRYARRFLDLSKRK